MADSISNSIDGYSVSTADDDIAIIGMALRLADDVSDQHVLWDFLTQKRSAMSEFPDSRWSQTAHSGHSAGNMLPQKGAHFMKGDLACFDGPFFSISPLEIASMDPQQRISLECSYQALENAGLTLSGVAGTNTSVYVGGSSHDYELQLGRDPDVIEKYRATGTNMGLLANRVSWFYDFTGPSMAIDTACSSSLNALHLACQSLKSGESSMGLVGGANVILQVDSMMALHSLGMLSHNSISRSFDADADGFARGEGCGFVVLKRVSDAVRDRNTIRAIIRASCIGQDGHTPSIVQPSSTAQMQLIRLAYKNLDMQLTRYVEAHGTGTRLGDSLEADAINTVFQPTAEKPLYIGSVKANFGHLEAASGMLSLIKTVLVLEHGIIPPNPFFNSPNPQIEATGPHLKFPKVNTVWPDDGLRRASINSFGFGGANVHVVVDDALHHLKSLGVEGVHNTAAVPTTGLVMESTVEALAGNSCSISEETTDPQLLVWSAADKDGINRYKTILKDYSRYVRLSRLDQNIISDLAYTLSEKRNHLAWRGFTLARDTGDFIQSMAYGKIPVTKARQNPGLAFVFTGQGANWPTMGRRLRIFPIFEASLKQAQLHLQTLGSDWNIEEELDKPKSISRLHLPEYSQPVCTIIQMALVDLFRHWNVNPHVVVGHSSGEIAAAYCAGAISQISAWTIAYARGAAVKSLQDFSRPSQGMMAVGLSEEDAIECIARTLKSRPGSSSTDLSLACINSFNSVTVSGVNRCLEDLQVYLKKKDVFCRRLNVNIAYHSQAMNDISHLYYGMIGPIESGLRRGTAPMMISTVTSTLVTHKQLRDPSYWVKNLVSPVLFKQAIMQLRRTPEADHKHSKYEGISQLLPPVDTFVEIGPHSALKGPLRNNLTTINPGIEFQYVPSLLREESDMQSILTAAGILFQRGVPVDVDQVNASRTNLGNRQRRMIVDLPPYVFDHRHRYWAEGRLSKNYRFRRFPPHELLGHQVMDWNHSVARWQNFISLTSHPWVEHHRVAGAFLYPAAGMVAMAIEASRQLNPDKSISGFRLKNVSIVKALIVPDHVTVETQLILEEQADQNDPLSVWYKFRLFQHEEDTFSQLFHGMIGIDVGNSNPEKSAAFTTAVKANPEDTFKARVTRSCTKAVPGKAFYDLCYDHGLQYGPSFCGIDNLFLDSQHCARATVDLDHWKNSIDATHYQPHIIHPAALDAAIQLPFAALDQMRPGVPVAIPTKFEDLWISASLFDSSSSRLDRVQKPKFEAFAEATYSGFRNASIELMMIDTVSGSPVLKCRGTCTTIDDRRHSPTGFTMAKPLCYTIQWRPDLDAANLTDIQQYCSIGALPKITEAPETIARTLSLGYLSAQRALRQIDGRTLSEQNQKYVKFLGSCLDNIDSELPLPEQIIVARESESEEFFNHLCNTVEALSPEGRLMARIARHMQLLLSDEVDIVELLFSDDVLSQFYEYAIDIDTGFCKLRGWIEAYAHKHPSCKFLEVGAGTGASARYILEYLHRTTPHCLEEYMFTDISAGFFERAKILLEAYGDTVSYATLDISSDPGSQGHKLAHYDVVTATNVLHATSDIRSTLENVRSLLRPDGKLIVAELVNASSIFPGFGVGFFPGWWSAKELHRSISPLLSESQWNTALLDAGFSGIDISFKGYRGQRHSTSTMISTVRQTGIPKTITNSCYTSAIWVVIDPKSMLQQELALQLQSHLGSMCRIDQLVNIPRLGQIEQCIFLPSVEGDVLQSATSDQFTTLTSLITRCRNLVWVYSMNLVTDLGPVNAAIDGFVRTAMSEQPDNGVRLLELSSTREPFSQRTAEIAEKILYVSTQANDSRYSDHQLSYKEQDGMLYINRLQTLSSLDNFISERTILRLPMPTRLDSQCLKLTIATPGSLESLHFVNTTAQDDILEGDQILVSVKACGLNFKDLLLALGKVPENLFGVECSGIVTAVGSESPFAVGDRVSCFTEGCMATHVRCKSALAIKIPSEMTFIQGASWQASFVTAYYSLIYQAQISEGESILIHSGAGALGQACIQIAQLNGLTIFVTVGNRDKAQFLTDKYGIPGDHIFDSRTSRFEHDIMQATDGRGVDVVVNSLSGELLQASWRCIGSFGRFIETGKHDIWVGNNLPLSNFKRSASFIAVDASQLARFRPTILNRILKQLLKMFGEGKLSILNITVYPLPKVEEAFREFSTGNTTGKFVLEISKEDVVMAVPPMHIPWRFSPNATYMIVGGLGGIGRSIARWMSGRGATHLVLLGRRGATSSAAKELVIELKQMGTEVATPACDVRNESSLREVLSSLSGFPPIKGCIQAAMVLEDVTLKSMSRNAYNNVVEPKIKGTWNLHKLLPSGMDFFVILSSVSGIVGLHGQANYASASSYLDGLARYRVQQGERAVCLDIGKILDVGYVAESKEKVNNFVMDIFPGIAEKELHALLEFFCQPMSDGMHRDASMSESQVVVGIDSPDMLRARGLDVTPPYMEQALFRPLLQVKAQSTNTTNAATSTNISELLSKAETLNAATDLIVQGFASKLQRTLGLRTEEFDDSNALQKYGIDSLSAVELRTWLRTQVGADTPVFDLLSEKSIFQIAYQAASTSSFVRAEVKPSLQKVDGASE